MATLRRPAPKTDPVADFFGALRDDADSPSGWREQLLMPGRLIADRYTLCERIGKGGMATVWEAEDADTDGVVALKFLGNEYLDDPEYHRRFEAEASAVARLRSPFTIRVFDYGVEDDTPFIAMERLYGVDLHARLTEAKRVSFEAAARVATDAGAALEEAHEAGIIHRDLKPKNLFIVTAAKPRSAGARQRGMGELVKLLDFGVAKHAGTADLFTASGIMLGSPFYMSPEQIHGDRDLDLRCDLWSLAAILYRAITGVKAFEGDMGRVMYLITSERHRAPSKVAPEAFVDADGAPLSRSATRAIDSFFEQGLAKDRVDRFQSARALVDAFLSILP